MNEKAAKRNWWDFGCNIKENKKIIDNGFQKQWIISAKWAKIKWWSNIN